MLNSVSSIKGNLESLSGDTDGLSDGIASLLNETDAVQSCMNTVKDRLKELAESVSSRQAFLITSGFAAVEEDAGKLFSAAQEELASINKSISASTNIDAAATRINLTKVELRMLKTKASALHTTLPDPYLSQHRTDCIARIDQLIHTLADEVEALRRKHREKLAKEQTPTTATVFDMGERSIR